MVETELTDTIVTLRPVRVIDAEQVYEAVHESLTDLKPWMSWAHDRYSRGNVDDFIQINRAGWEAGTQYGFAVIDSQNGDFVGVCGLNHLHPVYHLCNLGYWVRTSRHGEGIAVRAAKLAARYGFEHGGIIRAEVVIAIGNQKSIRVAEKIGAHYEGILLNRMVVGRFIYDAKMYSIIPQDFGLIVKL